MPLSTGRRLGPYEILSPLGAGGMGEVYKARSQVSRNGGSQPVWRRNGKELFFLAPDGKLMSAAVMTGATFSHDTPRPLFQTRMRPTYPPYPVDYDVTADAQRFLISAVRPDTGPVISIVTNWIESLKQD